MSQDTKMEGRVLSYPPCLKTGNQLVCRIRNEFVFEYVHIGSTFCFFGSPVAYNEGACHGNLWICLIVYLLLWGKDIDSFYLCPCFEMTYCNENNNKSHFIFFFLLLAAVGNAGAGSSRHIGYRTCCGGFLRNGGYTFAECFLYSSF